MLNDNITKEYLKVVAEQTEDGKKLDFLKELANLLYAYKASISIDTDKPVPQLRMFIGETDSMGIELPSASGQDYIDEDVVRALIKKLSKSENEVAASWEDEMDRLGLR